MLLVDPELAAPRRRAPVHAPDAVAVRELSEIDEFDPLALLPRDVVAAEHLRLRRLKQLAKKLLPWIDLQRQPYVRRPFPRDEIEAIARAQEHATNAVPTPPRAAEVDPHVSRLTVTQVERRRVVPTRNLQPARYFE